MEIIQPLDLQRIFVNTFSGSWAIFYFLAIVGFGYLAARFRMPNYIFLMLMSVFIVFMAPFYPLLYVLLITCVGLFLYFGISRLIKAT